MSGTRMISTTLRHELSIKFFFLQGKVPKEIQAILTETLAYFLAGGAKDLPAPPVLVSDELEIIWKEGTRGPVKDYPCICLEELRTQCRDSE